MENDPRLIIFASGSKTGGGSGFEKLAENQKKRNLKAKIVAVVSNHNEGGVREKADRLKIPFEHFSGPWTPEGYQEIIAKYKAEWTALSGWLKPVKGLSPRTTFNIHPGPLPQFGGVGMYGHHVHEAVMKAYCEGKVRESAVTMHFVTPEYDEGPVFFRIGVEIKDDDTSETLGARVNKLEHTYQSKITDLVIHEKIKWDGVDPKTLVTPLNTAWWLSS